MQGYKDKRRTNWISFKLLESESETSNTEASKSEGSQGKKVLQQLGYQLLELRSEISTEND